MKSLRTLLAQSACAVWVVGSLTFLLTRMLPGDMAYRIAAGRYGHDLVDTAAAQSVSLELGLQTSVFFSYLDWLKELATWDLGVSLVSGISISSTLLHEFGNTLSLALGAFVLSLLIGPPLGIYFAVHTNKRLDHLSLLLAVITKSVPAYVIGILLILLFGVGLHWLPVAGYGSLAHYILPALTLALPLVAVSARITSRSLQTVMASAYFEFAQLKGLSFWQTLVHHGLKNMAIPVLAFHGVQLIYLIEGVVIVETLFAWPGIGHSMVHAVVARDVPMIQGTSICLALSFICLNTALDTLYQQLDPRKRVHV